MEQYKILDQKNREAESGGGEKAVEKQKKGRKTDSPRTY